jgi:DNA invertase Pin-like site-specific DNA recombinase
LPSCLAILPLPCRDPDLSTPHGRVMATILAGTAEFER